MKKIKNIATLFIFTLSLLLIYSCGDDPVPPGNDPDPGILLTDEFGNIIGGDTTDWCLGGGGLFRFGPAFPNPTTSNSVQVKLQSPVTDTVKIFFIKNTSDTVIFYEGIVNAGSYTFQYLDSTNQFANTYQRLHLSSANSVQSQYCRFYGDIKFEP